MFEYIGWIVEEKIKGRKRDASETVTKGGDALKAKLTAIALTTLVAVHSAYAGDSREVVLTSEVKWEQLNPARGDKSPQAGTLWGDRKGPVPTGFLAKFVDGFSSPPHIHNATYRAVVISGSIHNDDPEAVDMWMPAAAPSGTCRQSRGQRGRAVGWAPHPRSRLGRQTG